ncbi:MAG: PQQ-binding-like beta-propeller repeat protein [Verrucomicrobiota bacterium]
MRSLFLICFIFATGIAVGEDWPGLRGPGGLAVSASDDNGVLSALGDETLLWKVEAGSGHSSPCITGDRIFLTSVEEDGKTFVMTAYDRADGNVLWRQQVSGTKDGRYGHIAANPAAPTAGTDGERVYFYFGGYGLMARDVQTGDLIWEKRLSYKPQGFGAGTSPILLGDLLVLNRDGTEDGGILGLSAKDGEVVWTIPRPGFRGTYATPFAWNNLERVEIVVPGTNSLRAYDPKDGSPFWNVDDLCVFPCTTPVASKDRLFFAAWATPNADADEQREQIFWGDIKVSAEEAEDPDWLFKRYDKNEDGRIVREEIPDSRALHVFNFVDRNRDDAWSRKEVTAIQLSKAPGRNIMVAVNTDGKVAWTFEKGKALPYVSSPLLLNDRVYLIKSGGVLTCLNAADGSTVFGPERCGVSGEYYASPIAWGDKVILCAQRGIVLVLRDGDEMKIVNEFDLGEGIYATPAIVDGVLYLRSDQNLWAFGMKD